MNIEDIGHHVASGDPQAIERAYRVIASYPDEEAIEGANASNLYAAFAAVTAALAKDMGIMPSETCVSANLAPGSTYAQAAEDFAGNRSWWMNRLHRATLESA